MKKVGRKVVSLRFKIEDKKPFLKVKRKTEETKQYFLDISSKVNPEAYKKLKSLNSTWCNCQANKIMNR